MTPVSDEDWAILVKTLKDLQAKVNGKLTQSITSNSAGRTSKRISIEYEIETNNS